MLHMRAARLLTTLSLIVMAGVCILQLRNVKRTGGPKFTVLAGPEFDIDLKIGKDVRLPTVCQNLTCKSAYVRHLQPRVENYFPIPAVRHLLWRGELVSAYFADQLRTWKAIHPDWTVVLWRDEDLKPFVSKHFPGVLPRFLELAIHPIMQVDMIRYMLLYKFGGVYADLDYKLAGSLDEYRRFHAVVTREPEAHSLQFWGFHWPPRPMASPAFLMSAPGHAFFRFCTQHLRTVIYARGRPLSFAGPLGLTQMVEEYSMSFPIANSPLETVYMPPSYSFHPYEGNRMDSSRSVYLPLRLSVLRESCKRISNDSAHELQLYCTDINNMDPITDRSQPVVAVHDLQKSGAIYDGSGSNYYLRNLTDVRIIFPKLQFGKDWT